MMTAFTTIHIMSVYRFSEWDVMGRQAWYSAACTFCGQKFEEVDDVHVEWRCSGTVWTSQGFQGVVTVFLHGHCAKEWAIHLASDSLKTVHKRVDPGPG